MTKINARKVGDGKSLTQTIKSLEGIIASKESPVDIKKIAHIWLAKVGGPAGFVRMLQREYKLCDSGSLARSRIMDLMLKLLQMATPKEQFGDYGDLNDDDLKSVFKSQLGPAPPQWIDHVCI